MKTALAVAAVALLLPGCASEEMKKDSPPAAEKADHAAAPAPPAHANSACWTPVESMHLYLCAFHTAKENPGFQVEAHHFCAPQGSLHQCVVYDSKGPNAKLLGVEYIIGDEAYQALP